MPGAIYGNGYRELGSHCFAYIHATEVGGTHPALIEAMGRGALVLYRNTTENAEVAAGAGIPFENDLAKIIRLALTMPEAEREELRRRAADIVRERYCWDRVTSAYRAPVSRPGRETRLILVNDYPKLSCRPTYYALYKRSTMLSPFGKSLVLAISVCCSYALADNVLHPSTPVLDRPTLITLGIKLPISGDDNFNGKVTVRYRKAGTATWTEALPLFRVHPENTFNGLWPHNSRQ